MFSELDRASAFLFLSLQQLRFGAAKKTVRHEDGENFHKMGVFPLPQTTTKTHKNKKYV